ncbi:Cardioacceleratory peptide receptor, partial [Cryptotermes secundus]
LFAFLQVEQFTVLWILLALIVLGNSAVLVTLYVNKRKSRMNFFIMQLAVADLTVGLISVLTDVIWRITVVWHAGNFACKLIRFLQAVVTYSSTYVLVALSIDRYDAITHPMNFSGSCKTQCWIELPHPWQWQLYLSLVAVSLFVLPALIISGCYAVIVLTIWRKGKTLTPTSRSYRSRGQHRLQQEEQNCRRASSRGLIPKAKIKTVKMTFVIVFAILGHPHCLQIKDWRCCCSVHSVLESLLRFRVAPSIRPRAKHAEQHRHRHVYTEPGAAQLCCQPSHLLPLLHAHVQDSEVRKTICRREMYHCC